MKNEIVLHPSSTHSLGSIILGGGIMMMGGFLLDSATFLVLILGLLNVLLGLIVVIFGSLALLHIRSKITLSNLGIKDSRILKEFVTWIEIDNVELIYENRHNKLLISLRNEVDFSNFSFLYKIFKSKKSNQFQKEFKLDLSSIEVNYGELLLFLKQKNLHTY
jgi:hypothetical protein